MDAAARAPQSIAQKFPPPSGGKPPSAQTLAAAIAVTRRQATIGRASR